MSEKDWFKEMVTKMIEFATKKRQEQEQKKVEIENQIRELDEHIVTLQATLRIYEKWQDEIIPPPIKMGFQNRTLGDWCYHILVERGGKAKVSDIVRVLRLTGKPLQTKTYRAAYVAVYKVLDLDKRFERIGKGEFALAEVARKELCLMNE